ncbi:bifunctional adenosylcobinamide kinase/adenosylcobinamide-phosphate guanylyltransferase [Mesobacillus jeotgali]|uniref:bifunctional adenosylcobinamide kinase/adenosylcobinamide-phosphate guanylyltransferase n=1 Tax=Mesobacillus jeotgali TaxID=129985 RepID=UPI0009A56751|nr:bifunctional adenosylcobinamide kinase/adenosylcobinamide-phosphate guanylyltransferase [Mesobacillus jeotgali]
MHFVTGGAFNGKSKWVREQYQLDGQEFTWTSAYKGDEIPVLNGKQIIVLEGIEVWIRQETRSIAADESRETWQSIIRQWLQWESKDQQRKLVLIGSDISKGIVPIATEDRSWRDTTGWVYQDLVSAAERVDVIWYGISQKLK